MSPAACSLPLLLLLTLFPKPGSSTCPESGRIQCRSTNKCTYINYFCDGDNDCEDNSDEEIDLCQAWGNDECGRGKVMCQRFGGSGCVDITDYCQQPCGGTLDRRVCVMLEADKLQPLSEIRLPTTSTTNQPSTTRSSTCSEDNMIQCRSNNRCIQIGFICDGDNDCGDNSDEENDLCQAWRNNECVRGQVMCKRFGGSGCVDITDYCQQPCGGTLDRRVCVMLEANKLQPLSEIRLPNAATTTKCQEVGAPLTPASSPLDTDTDSANIITISMTNTIIKKGASNELFLAKLLEAIQTYSQPTMEGGDAVRPLFLPASD